jgi:hypothetical protein
LTPLRSSSFSPGTLTALAINGTLKVISGPAMGLPVRLGDGNFRFTLSGPVGYAYTLGASTNVAKPLAQWEVVANGTISSNPFTMDDRAATNFPHRFYRLSVP